MRHQFITRVSLGIYGDGCIGRFTNTVLVFLRCQPFVVVSLRLHIHNDRHKTVFFAAQLCAIATVDARTIRAEPGVTDKSGNGVLLDSQRRHPPSMQDIICGEQYAHFPSYRHHQRVIYFEQIIFTLSFGTLDLRQRGSKSGYETETFVDIVVTPFPLVCSDLHCHLWR